MYQIQESKLWQTAFDADNIAPAQQAALRRLLETYSTLESRVKSLLELIPRDCHGLTIHDLSHVHQLWSVADQVCGEHYPLNPLEGFVLGAAFLIHDAGLTAAAYPGGLTAIKECSLYRDILSYKKRSQNRPTNLEEKAADDDKNLEKQALFETLRELHAKRAEHLLEAKFKHPLIDFEYTFISDLDIYLDCGEIIGLIAASHHWPIKKVSERFRDPLTPPAAFSGWTIDAFKLACILRCSDACAIDERRARIMPFLLLAPDSTSLHHWDFQARLKPGLLRGSSLVFESKIAFGRDSMSSWWTAFDSITVADQELRDCDKEIRARLQRPSHSGLKRFAAINVEGANDPERLKEFIKVARWIPVDTAVRIGNPVSLIEKLGGWALYGNDLIAPMRELIQNAADAVRARACQDQNNNYRGLIDIEIDINEKEDKIQPYKIIISDNGIGMPREILTDTLLNFGESLWSSQKLPFTYPGLSDNARFKPTGQFGIGFYSVFMIADRVSVTSRAWDEGAKTAKTLYFQHGIKSRAELRDYDSNLDRHYRSDHTTSIELSVNKLSWINHIAQQSSSIFDDESTDADAYWNSVKLTFSRLVFALNVECRLKIGSMPAEFINRTDLFDIDNRDFANHFNEVMVDQGDNKRIITDREVPIIRTISSSDGNIHTRGLIDIAEDRGWAHVGGLSVFNRVDGLIKGIVGYYPGTAARQGGPRVSSKLDLQNWAKGQLELIFQHDLTDEDRFRAVAAISTTGVDVTDKALLRSNGEIISIDGFVRSIKTDSRIFLPIERNPITRPYYDLSPSTIRHDIRMTDIVNGNYEALVNGSGGINVDYNRVNKDLSISQTEFSLYAKLIRFLTFHKFTYEIKGPDSFILGYYSGPDGGRGRLLDRDLKSGDPIMSWGLSMDISLGR